MSTVGVTLGATMGDTLGGIAPAPPVYPVYAQPVIVIVQVGAIAAAVVGPPVQRTYRDQRQRVPMLHGFKCDVQDASLVADCKVEEDPQ